MIGKRDLQDRLEIKEKIIDNLETQETLFDRGEPYHNTVLDILEFLSQPGEERHLQREEWTKYYEAVRGTNAYKRYQMQKGAFERGDFGLVSEIARVSRKALKENKRQLTKPNGIDFEFLIHGSQYQRYSNLKSEVASLRRQLGEEDTFETAKGIFK